jgi:hypothetical protein
METYAQHTRDYRGEGRRGVSQYALQKQRIMTVYRSKGALGYPIGQGKPCPYLYLMSIGIPSAAAAGLKRAASRRPG